MKKVISIFFVLTIFIHPNANCQTKPYAVFSNPGQIPWDNYIPANTKFVLSGEAHTVSSNYPFQLGQLKYLVSKGFRNLVCELPYSFGYILQQYISTGNDSLLRFVGWANEFNDYWKGVYELNRTLPENDKIHIWGIDHELGNNLYGDYRKKLFIKAIELMVKKNEPMPPALHQEILSLKADTSMKAVINTKNRLRQLLGNPEVVSYFGATFLHFQVLVNRLDHYKVNRNDEMFDAFKEICSQFHLPDSSKFLASFGWAHTGKSVKKSLAWRLQNDPSSPVNANTFVIGVQYLNCGLTARNTDSIGNVGIVSNRSLKKALAALDEEDPSPVRIFTYPCEEKYSSWTNSADILFVFSGFPGVTQIKR